MGAPRPTHQHVVKLVGPRLAPLAVLSWLGWAMCDGAARGRQREGTMLGELADGLLILSGQFVFCAAIPRGARILC